MSVNYENTLIEELKKKNDTKSTKDHQKKEKKVTNNTRVLEIKEIGGGKGFGKGKGDFKDH